MHIGEVLKKIRNKCGLTQNQVCAKTKITQGYLSNIESGNYYPSEECLGKLAKLYKVPAEIIVLAKLDEKQVPQNKRELFRALQFELVGLFIELLD